MFRISIALIMLAVIASTTGAGEHSTSLQRSGLVVYVNLLDAKGQMLVVEPSETASLFLWRECGDFHRSAHAWYDWEHSRVVCGG